MKVLSDNDGTMRQIKRLVQVQRQKQRQKKGDYLVAPGQSTNNFRTSGDQYSLLNEVIGIRRSMQNIDYKTTCLTCCNSEALGSYKSCPRCPTLLDSQLNMNVRQKQARLSDIDENPLLSSRSNNCQYNRISPMVEHHYSPRPQISGRCSDMMKKVAHERAHEARRSHRRYDLRQCSPEMLDSRLVQLSNRGNSRRRGQNSPATRLQPSQSQNFSLPQTSRSYQNLQEYVLVENKRHGSCAIQQPCNFCSNTGCFSPINGTRTCCFELLEKQGNQQPR